MKIEVPEGMLKAAGEASGWVPWQEVAVIPKILEAALNWLADNPIVPTADQMLKMSREIDAMTSINIAVEWQRRMFLAPELPPEEIADLKVSCDMGWKDPINKRIIEAFRRGLDSRK